MKTPGAFFLKMLWLPVLSGILFFLIGWHVNDNYLKPKFSATTNLYVMKPPPEEPEMLYSYDTWYIESSFAKEIKEFLATDYVIDEAIKRMKEKYPTMTKEEIEGFSKYIKLEKGAESRLLKLSFTSANPDYSISAVNILSQVLKDRIREITDIDNIKILQMAKVAKTKVIAPREVILGISIVTGFFAGFILIYIFILIKFRQRGHKGGLIRGEGI